MFHSVSGVPDQINSGRDGGVIIAPWFISEAGSDLAHEQMRQCLLTEADASVADGQSTPRDLNGRKLTDAGRATLNEARNAD